MPLHLLGKKSWNVYNTANIERVRQDEEAARTKTQERERQEHDHQADIRLRLLRGEHPSETERICPTGEGHVRKKRKHAHDGVGDEDGDFQRAVARIDGGELRKWRGPDDTENVNIDRISNVKFRDAAGRDKSGDTSWYLSSNPLEPEDMATTGRNAFGREDVNRPARDQRRLNAADPLAAMRTGVKRLREVEKQRADWRIEREKDLNEVEELARRKRREQRRSKREHEKRDRGRDERRRERGDRRKVGESPKDKD